jgi:hypothetical protein
VLSKVSKNRWSGWPLSRAAGLREVLVLVDLRCEPKSSPDAVSDVLS